MALRFASDGVGSIIKDTHKQVNENKVVKEETFVVVVRDNNIFVKLNVFSCLSIELILFILDVIPQFIVTLFSYHSLHFYK